MKQPTLEEVKEYFKNAKKVKCAYDLEEANINKNIEREIYFDKITGYWIDLKNTQIKLWGFREGYAEILTYKEKTFTITESQIESLKESLSLFGMNERLKEWFPEAFESEVKSLPKDFTGWCKDDTEIIGNEKWLGYYDSGVLKYGFSAMSGEWFQDKNAKISKSEIEATEQEVFEALKNEAVKRGLKKGIMIQSFNKGFGFCTLSEKGLDFNFNDNKLNLGGCLIFDNGKWQTPIESITLSEAEQQLKKKIIV